MEKVLVCSGLVWFSLICPDLPWLTLDYLCSPWFTMVHSGMVGFPSYRPTNCTEDGAASRTFPVDSFSIVFPFYLRVNLLPIFSMVNVLSYCFPHLLPPLHALHTPGSQLRFSSFPRLLGFFIFSCSFVSSLPLSLPPQMQALRNFSGMQIAPAVRSTCLFFFKQILSRFPQHVLILVRHIVLQLGIWFFFNKFIFPVIPHPCFFFVILCGFFYTSRLLESSWECPAAIYFGKSAYCILFCGAI